MDVERVDSEEGWNRILAKVGQSDFYHSFTYHSLEARRADAMPRMYVVRGSNGGLVIPMLMRDIPNTEKHDATSVYGYPGPLAWGTPPSGETLYVTLTEALSTDRVVSVFGRMHPLLNGTRLSLPGRIEHSGSTVAIDLTSDEDVQLRGYRSNHRSGVRKLVRSGYGCRISTEMKDLETFHRVYEETMLRVSAREEYFFSMDYLKVLVNAPDIDMRVAVCELGGEITAAGLFSFHYPVAEYHLGGTAEAHLKAAPMKLLFDFVRRAAKEFGLESFHLGGGLGGLQDSLFNFKAGFSPLILPFRTWRWIVLPDEYQSLASSTVVDVSTADYFPAYRAGQ